MSEEIETDPILLSRCQTGLRHYSVDPDTYDQLAAGVDSSRGYPRGAGTRAVTVTGLIDRSKLQEANDGSGKVLVTIRTHRFTDADDSMLAPAIQAGLATELTQSQYESLKPASR